MPQTERKNASLEDRELLAALNAKSDDREPILNDGLVSRISGILGQASVVQSESLSFEPFNRWNLTTSDGKILDLFAYPTKRGRVGSADILAYDCLRITYEEDMEMKTAYMQGISEIALLKDEDGTASVEFVQKTDKRTNRIKVSNKGVVVGGNGSGRTMPLRFIKGFTFL